MFQPQCIQPDEPFGCLAFSLLAEGKMKPIQEFKHLDIHCSAMAMRGGFMDNMIETPKISEILYEEFMEPLNISAYRLANDIHVPVSRIQDILHDRRKITVDTSLRLARYFGVSDRYFINLQNDIDIRNALMELADDINSIQPISRVES